LQFLGTTYQEPHAGQYDLDADIVLELWDQGFPAWAPLRRALTALPLALAGRSDTLWRVAASGVLWLPGQGEAPFLSDPPMQAPGPEWTPDSLVERFSPQPDRLYALVALGPEGFCLPLGLGSRDAGWIRFTLRAGAWPSRPLRVQLREGEDSGWDVPPIKAWRVLAESIRE
jgi:hypothetical protein